MLSITFSLFGTKINAAYCFGKLQIKKRLIGKNNGDIIPKHNYNFNIPFTYQNFHTK